MQWWVYFRSKRCNREVRVTYLSSRSLFFPFIRIINSSSSSNNLVIKSICTLYTVIIRIKIAMKIKISVFIIWHTVTLLGREVTINNNNNNNSLWAAVGEMILSQLLNLPGFRFSRVVIKSQNSSNKRSINKNSPHRLTNKSSERIQDNNRSYMMVIHQVFNNPHEATTTKFEKIDHMTNITLKKTSTSTVYQSYSLRYKTTCEQEDNPAWERKWRQILLKIWLLAILTSCERIYLTACLRLLWRFLWIRVRV